MRPNVLFFVTDQQHADHVGYAGNRVVRTPHIDSLAEAGSWFSHFHVASPTCMSNRATFMTGRLPSLNKVRCNGVPLPLEAVTFVDLLRAGGYRTALIGKSHLQGMSTEATRVPRRPFRCWRSTWPASACSTTRWSPPAPSPSPSSSGS